MKKLLVLLMFVLPWFATSNAWAFRGDGSKFVEFIDMQAFEPVFPKNALGQRTLGWKKNFDSEVKGKYRRIGAVTDGASTVLIRIQPILAHNQKVLVKIKYVSTNTELPTSADVVGYLSKTFQPPQSERSNTTITLDENEPKMVYYCPPDQFLFNPKRELEKIKIEVSAVDGTPLEVWFEGKNYIIPISYDFTLRRPWVILAHGICSDAGSMEQIANGLIARDGVQPIDFDYSKNNTASPADKIIQDGLNSKILGIISALNDSGYAATKVDYVGHSMGGLVAKWHTVEFIYPDIIAQTPNVIRGNGFPALELTEKHYLTAKNFGLGDFRRVITIDTPFRGSEVATVIADRIGWKNTDWMDFVSNSTLMNGLSLAGDIDQAIRGRVMEVITGGIPTRIGIPGAYEMFHILHVNGGTGDGCAISDLSKNSGFVGVIKNKTSIVLHFPIASRAGTKPRTDQFPIAGNDYIWGALLYAGNVPDPGLTAIDSDWVVKYNSQLNIDDAVLFVPGNYKHYDVPGVIHTEAQKQSNVVIEILKALDSLDAYSTDVSYRKGVDRFNNSF